MSNDVFPRGDRAGKRHHPHLFMPGQRITHGFAAPEQHIKHPGREDGFCQFSQFQGGERRDLRGFKHHAVPGGQRRGQLPGRHHQRIVPGGDRRDNAHRVAADQRGVSLQIFPRRRTVQGTRRASKEAKHVGYGRNFIPQYAVQGFAAVLRLQPRQGVGIGLDGIRQPEQALGAAFWRGAPPAGEGPIGGLYGSIHLGG